MLQVNHLSLQLVDLGDRRPHKGGIRGRQRAAGPEGESTVPCRSCTMTWATSLRSRRSQHPSLTNVGPVSAAAHSNTPALGPAQPGPAPGRQEVDRSWPPGLGESWAAPVAGSEVSLKPQGHSEPPFPALMDEGDTSPGTAGGERQRRITRG